MIADKIKVKIRDLPSSIKQTVVQLLKKTNPTFEITDDTELTIIKKINTLTATNVEFYRIEADDLRYGCDFIEDSWNFFEVLVYTWTTEPTQRFWGDIDVQRYCDNVAVLYLLLKNDLTLEDIMRFDESMITKYIRDNFCTWIQGFQFYDAGDNKIRTITQCKLANFNCEYNVKNNSIYIDLTFIDGVQLKADDKDVLSLWKPENKDLLKIKTVKAVFHFYGVKIPVEVEIVGGEGVTA